MLIERLKNNFKPNEPIFTNEILSLFKDYSRSYVFKLINKAIKNNEILNFSNGVYFIPTKTIVGTSTITTEDVIKKKYITNNKDVYGIYSGLYLQNMFHISTQMPNTIEIVSNNETMRCRNIKFNGRNIILRKSRCTINKTNVNTYILLQLITDYKQKNELNNFTKQTIKKYIKDNNITILDIINLSKEFPAETMKKLIDSGVIYEFTQ